MNAIITQSHKPTHEEVNKKNGWNKCENQRTPYNPRAQPNPPKFRKMVRSTMLAVLSFFFFWVGLALGLRSRLVSFNIYLYMFSNPTSFGKSITPYSGHWVTFFLCVNSPNQPWHGGCTCPHWHMSCDGIIEYCQHCCGSPRAPTCGKNQGIAPVHGLAGGRRCALKRCLPASFR